MNLRAPRGANLPEDLPAAMRILNSLLLAAATLAAPPAFAADYYGAEPAAPIHENALVPACDDTRVLGQVEDQFEHGAVNMLKSDLTITEFSGMHEKAYFPQAEDRPIERRYCQGEVLLSDLQRHTVYYTVSYPLGYASIGWKAEGCVLGLDRWLVYGANCSSLRRF